MSRKLLLSVSVWLACSVSAFAAAIPFSVSGLDATSIQVTVDAFRTALGTNNGAAATPFPSGRREVNWDGVPDALSAPNPMPKTQFQARGILFDTPGTGFQVSANAGGVALIEFDNLAAGNSSLFAPFSAQKLFTAVGSPITDVTFIQPGSSITASTSAFGAVFSDVDLPGVTSLEFFDLINNSLGIFPVLSATGMKRSRFWVCGLMRARRSGAFGSLREIHLFRHAAATIAWLWTTLFSPNRKLSPNLRP